jgi:iron complex outermembrane receptor protein
MNKIILSSVAILLMNISINANNLDSTDDFESLLDEISEIATKTKINIDYQASVVSVLRAEKLKKIGIKNLHEAIGLLPGIETSILHTGWKQVIIRGSYNPDTYILDKYKLYIDGLDVGSNLYSTSYYYLDFPIELIDRIEVLRGSASTIYGPGAFNGAINVITKSSQINSQDNIFASVGSYEYYKGGFVKHLSLDEWQLAIDSYYQSNNKALDAGEKFKSTEETNYLRSDYTSLEDFDDFSIGLMAKHDDFQLITRYKSEKSGNYYGLNEEIEPVPGGYVQNKSAIIELRDRYKLPNSINIDTKIGFNLYSFIFDSTINNDYSGTGYKLRVNPIYKQLISYIDFNINGNSLDTHNWMFGVELQKIKTLKNEFGTTVTDNGFSTKVEYYDGEYGFINGDNNQLIQSVYFQDIYSFNDSLDFSFNIRYDDYSLFDSMFSYRIGSVYRVNDKNIFKAIYGRSYRAPSYIEAFQANQAGLKDGNPNLNSELIDTYEIAYTYKGIKSVTRANIFYSVLQDVIDTVSNQPADFEGRYANQEERNSKGAELEFKYIFSNNLELMANLSYVRAQYFSNDYVNPIESQSPQISEVLSKGYLLYSMNKNLSLNTAWYYSGPKNGFHNNQLSEEYDIDSTILIDETLVYNIDYSSKVILSVKNIFNETVLYPSYFDNQHDFIVREGRNWLFSYEKKF